MKLILTALTAAISLSTAQATDRVLVPAGDFQMGCSVGDDLCDEDEGTKGGVSVHVPAFFMDKNEVTVAEYRVCVEAGKCSMPLTHQDNKYCNYDAPGRDNHPINCVDWQFAQNYCASYSGRLPLEAEWEKAARGGSATRYPWGQDVSCKEAVLDEVSPAASNQEPDGCYTDATLPIGSRAANAFGIYDMNGNAGEWVANWYAPDALSVLYAKGDLQGPKNGRQKGARGGSWDENKPNLRSSFRNVKPPEQAGSIYGSIGFRCAADS